MDRPKTRSESNQSPPAASDVFVFDDNVPNWQRYVTSQMESQPQPEYVLRLSGNADSAR